MPWIFVRRRRRVRRKASKKSKDEFKLLAPHARVLVHERLEHFNRHYGYIFGKVFIRNTRSRWGSCSSRGNLGFNYRIVKLPPALQNYIVVHELCHLKEFNHSPQFWALVAEQVPNWKALRANLRKVRISATM